LNLDTAAWPDKRLIRKTGWFMKPGALIIIGKTSGYLENGNRNGLARRKEITKYTRKDKERGQEPA
jgi:hypothetical protein